MSADRNAPITEMIAATRAMRDNAERLAKDCRARGDKSLAAEWAAIAYERARFVRMLEGLRDDIAAAACNCRGCLARSNAGYVPTRDGEWDYIGTDEPCATRIAHNNEREV